MRAAGLSRRDNSAPLYAEIEVSDLSYPEIISILITFKDVPEFLPTAQPELDALLLKFREQLFIPTSLSRAHQKILYSPKKQHLLTNDPGITVNITDEEEVRLKPMKITDRPDNNYTMTKIAKLLGSTDDLNTWRNLYPFLQGMKTAQRPYRSVWLEKVTRKANQIGRHQAIVECAEQAESTNVRLSDPFITRQLLLGCHQRAVKENFDGKETTKALTMAKHLTTLMEKPEHCAKKTLPVSHVDMRTSLFVNAVMLELLAGGPQTVVSQRTDEIKGALLKVLAISRDIDGETIDIQMPELHRKRQKSPQNDLGVQADTIENLIPLWSGLKFASKASKNMRSFDRDRLNALLKAVEAELQRAESKWKELSGRTESFSLEMLEDVRKIHR